MDNSNIRKQMSNVVCDRAKCFRKRGSRNNSRRRNLFSKGRRPNGFLGLSLNDRTILFLAVLLDKTVSVG